MPADPVVLTVDGLQELIDRLGSQGYRVLGPTVRDDAVVYGEVTSVADLPAGYRDAQEPGRYRLTRTDSPELFGFATAATSWKSVLHPPREPVGARPQGATALLGVRSCDLAAVAVLDRVLAGSRHPDPRYTARRAGLFVVAVACGHPGGTCFCVSMGTGPRPRAGYDVLLVELADHAGHRFLAESGSDRGAELLSALSTAPAAAADRAAAAGVTEAATARMGRTMDTTDLRDLLYASAEHPRWDDVAGRCLACGNCTLACPTCFCTSAEDVTDLTEQRTERWTVWDSCFSLGFSHLSGGSVRTSVRSRYRQWLTHKLAGWHDQFGSSGCVGCGRCITWCPVGIDITEEVAAIRSSHADDQ